MIVVNGVQYIGWALVLCALCLYLWWKGYKYPAIIDKRRCWYRDQGFIDAQRKAKEGEPRSTEFAERCVTTSLDHYSCNMHVVYGMKEYLFRGCVHYLDDEPVPSIKLSYVLRYEDPPAQAHEMAMDELRLIATSISATKNRGEGL